VRLFVGIELDAALVQEAARVIGQLQRAASELAPRARITWIPPERHHLTVRFIGALDESRVRVVRDLLHEPLPIPPFEVAITGTGAFPSSGPPRVLWAGVADGREALLDVERETTVRLSAAGIPVEARAFNPHLTLARVRVPDGLRAGVLFERLADHRFGTSRVAAITLFESLLSPKGPRYQPLQRTQLRGREEGETGRG
jgi:2'-5' RNA ligase